MIEESTTKDDWVLSHAFEVHDMPGLWRFLHDNDYTGALVPAELSIEEAIAQVEEEGSCA